MSSKTTLLQIANAAGVSLSTVDRVVNRRGGVSPVAEAKVLEWAGRLNLDRRLFRGHLRKLRIAVMMQSPQNPFYKELRDAFTDLNRSLADRAIASFPHFIDVTDIAGTRAKIEDIATVYDGLVIIAPNEPRLADALRLVAGRIPIITMVTDIPGSGRIAYVGPDNHRTGRVAGELMGRFLGAEGGEIIVVLGMSRFAGHEEREAGFRSVLGERFPACRIVAALESGEDQMRAGEVVSLALDEHPRVRGIYNISAGNLAIARAIEAKGLASRITMITHELTPARRQLLRDGILDAVIDQNPRLEARRVLKLLERRFHRSEIDSGFSHYTPFDIFIRENCPEL